LAQDLKIKVQKIKGNCPVYQQGDSFQIKSGFRLNSTQELCLHSLASIMPYYTALSRKMSPEELGLAGISEKDGAAYLQCLDPCEITGGGTVIFRIEVE